MVWFGVAGLLGFSGYRTKPKIELEREVEPREKHDYAIRKSQVLSDNDVLNGGQVGARV